MIQHHKINSLQHTHSLAGITRVRAAGRFARWLTGFFVAFLIVAFQQPVVAQSAKETLHANQSPAKADGATTGYQAASVVLSKSGDIRVELSPVDGTIPLLELHNWQVRFFYPAFNIYIHPEHVSLSGGMKAHGHGLPTSPAVTGRNGDHYLISGVRFNMAGNWHLQVKFVYQGKIDSAEFTLEFGNDNNPSNSQSAGNISSADKQSMPVDSGHGEHKAAASTKWSPSEIALLKSLSLFSGRFPTNTRGNAHALSPAAASFGHKLFFDKRLSSSGQVSCASCHDPATYFNDQRTTGKGIGELDRNTPTLVGAMTHRWLYWDGRRDSLWSQALVPLEASNEMGSSRASIARTIAQLYRNDYEKVFGPMPRLPSVQTVPDAANPAGDDEARQLWSSVDADTRHRINTVFTNIGKALAAYQMNLRPAPSKFDHYVQQLSLPDEKIAQSAHLPTASHNNAENNTENGPDTPPLSQSELNGLKLFISGRTQCLNCHASAMFTNYGFHNIGTGIKADGSFDFGRMLGSQAVLFNQFNCRSRYADKVADNQNTTSACSELTHINQHEIATSMRGAFRVPGLRGLQMTAPYMHDGRYETLTEVIKHYSEPPAYLLGQFHEMPSIDKLTDNEIEDLAAFLLTLGSDIDTDQKWLRNPDN